MDKIKVLHIGLSDHVGGMESVVHSWLPFKPEHIQFDYANPYKNPLAFEEENRELGSQIHQITARSKNPIKSYFQLKKIIAEGDYDFIHHHIMSFSWPEPCLIVNRLKTKTQVILHAHTTINRELCLKFKVLDFLGRIRLRNKKYIAVACGQKSGESMYQGNPFILVKNGIDFARYCYNRQDRINVRKALNIDDEIVIGHVGRSCYEKNYPYLLKCFQKLAAKHSNVKLLLIGNLLHDETIQKQIDQLGIRQNVLLTGAVTNVVPYYSAMDVFFLPSVIEGISLALLEAQASGLPCVVSKNVPRESNISGKVDFVSIENDTEAIDALEQAIACADQHCRTSIQLDESFKLEYSAQVMMDLYEKHKRS